MPTESQDLQDLLEKDPESDPTTDAATDAAEESEGITPEDHSTKELPDGGAIIEMHDRKETRKALEFYSNLAEDMEESVLNELATKLDDLIEKDKEARKRRDEQYAEGIRRTGLGGDAPGGATFEGASKVVHPLMLEVSIDFSARVIKELWPADGPVKDKIIGHPSDKKEQKAKRKVAYMNWLLTEKMPSVRYELEQILTQVPLGGAAYSGLRWDKHRKRPEHDTIWVDEILLPFAATDYYKSDRKTHVQLLTEYEFNDRVRGGMYRDISSPLIVTSPDQTDAAVANDKAEGRDQSSYNEDGLRTVYEIDVQWLLPDEKRKIDDTEDSDEGPAPYLITLDESTKKILSIYRNWEEDDDTLEPLVHKIVWPFLPWRGAMPLGTPQVLGGIAAAATGALRALLDSAHINNFPGGVRLKSGPVGGQSVQVQQGQTTEIEGSVMQDDIRKTYMSTPVNPTSPVLYELLGFLVDAGHDLIKTTLDEANDNQNVPVGTTMARIEQGMVVFSAIHSRMHNAMGKLLRVLHRLLATYLDDEQVLRETGERMCFKADFDGPVDVIPVSDPEIFSELQRVSQIQTIAQRAQLFPMLYDLNAVEKGILSTLKVKDPEQYLKPVPKPQPDHAINENIAAALGKPIIAFPDQDHLAHIQSHCAFLEDPMFGASQMMAPQAVPAILENIKQHMLFWYGMQIHAIASEAAGKDITEFQSIHDAEVKTAFDQMLAAATQVVHKQTPQVFSGVPAVIQKAQALLQQLQPPAPMDPSVVESKKVDVQQQKVQQDAQRAQAENQLQAQALQQKATEAAQGHAIQQAQMQQDAQTGAGEAQVDVHKTALDAQTKVATTAATNASREKIAQASDATKIQTTQDDNNTAMEVAAAEIAAGSKSNVKDGQGLGGKPRIA
jgi:hypothetical protein